MKLLDFLLLAAVRLRLARDRGFSFSVALNGALRAHATRMSAEIGGAERAFTVQRAWKQQEPQRPTIQ